jgi:hypothetical protein
MATSRSGSRNGNGRNSTALVMLNIAVFAPAPKVSTNKATAVKPGVLRKPRTAYRISWESAAIIASGSYRLPEIVQLINRKFIDREQRVFTQRPGLSGFSSPVFA